MTTIEVLDFLADLAGSIGGRLIIERRNLVEIKLRLECDVLEAGKLKAVKQLNLYITATHLRLSKQAKFDYGDDMLRMFKRRVEHEFKAEIHAISGNPEALT